METLLEMAGFVILGVICHHLAGAIATTGSILRINNLAHDLLVVIMASASFMFLLKAALTGILA